MILSFRPNLTAICNIMSVVISWVGLKIYFKREDLNHTGAHKINNTVGNAVIKQIEAYLDNQPAIPQAVADLLSSMCQAMDKTVCHA